MDIIGKIYAHTGNMLQTDEGDVPEMALLPGWHVNYWEPVPAWSDYEVTPSTPNRMYAGHVTFYYRFADEAEFMAKAKEAGLWVDSAGEE